MADKGLGTENAAKNGGIARPRKHREDWDLVQRCVSGDRLAWETLFTALDKGLEVSIGRTLQVHGAVSTKDHVEDLKGDLVLALVRDDFRKLRTYSGRCRLGAWLKVVASNHVVDALRRRRPTVSFSDDTRQSRHLLETLADDGPCPHQTLIDHREADFIRTVSDRLTVEERRLFTLFVEEGRSFEEIAVALETTMGAVYARKNRLRKRLMRLVEKEFGPRCE